MERQDRRAGLPENGKYEQTKRQNGAYIATRLRPTDDLSLILGTRVSTFKYNDNYDYDGLNPVYFSDNQAGYKQHGVVTPYAGVVYDLDDTYSVYASYTSIYQPQTYKDANRTPLDPVEGDSYETGLKAAYFEGRLNASLALFRIEQDNVAVQTGTTNTNEGSTRPPAAQPPRAWSWRLPANCRRAGTCRPAIPMRVLATRTTSASSARR